MTPTLLGRVQTRLFLMTLFGLPITLLFVVVSLPTGPGALGPLVALAFVTLVGLAFDVVYDRMQQQRWDHDWPTWLQVVAGIVEGVASWSLLACCIPLWVVTAGAIVLFPLHYGLVWLAAFLFLQGPVYVVFPRWRYRGGRIV